MIQNALKSKVLSDTDVAALIVDRFYPLHLPQEPTYPCAVYQTTETKPLELMVGDPGYSATTFNISVSSEDYDVCIDLANKLRKAIERWSGTVVGVEVIDCMINVSDQEGYEPDLDIYYSQMTVTVHYKES